MISGIYIFSSHDFAAICLGVGGWWLVDVRRRRCFSWVVPYCVHHFTSFYSKRDTFSLTSAAILVDEALPDSCGWLSGTRTSSSSSSVIPPLLLTAASIFPKTSRSPSSSSNLPPQVSNEELCRVRLRLPTSKMNARWVWEREDGRPIIPCFPIRSTITQLWLGRSFVETGSI